MPQISAMLPRQDRPARYPLTCARGSPAQRPPHSAWSSRSFAAAPVAVVAQARDRYWLDIPKVGVTVTELQGGRAHPSNPHPRVPTTSATGPATTHCFERRYALSGAANRGRS